MRFFTAAIYAACLAQVTIEVSAENQFEPVEVDGNDEWNANGEFPEGGDDDYDEDEMPPMEEQ